MKILWKTAPLGCPQGRFYEKYIRPAAGAEFFFKHILKILGNPFKGVYVLSHNFCKKSMTFFLLIRGLRLPAGQIR